MAKMDQRDDSKPEIAGDHEPPAVFFPACGALCDVFWWARRSKPAAEESPADPTEPARDSR
jgi:hypothetical protein